MSRTGLALRVLIVLAAGVPLWRIAAALSAMRPDDPWLHLRGGAALSLCVVALVAVLVRIDGSRWRSLGIHSLAANFRAGCCGLLLWLIPAAAGMGLCIALGWVRITPASDIGSASATLALLLPAVLLIEALPEELLFRGYLQERFAARWSQGVTILLQAAAFVLFAWAVGAMSSSMQWLFLPGFALLLGWLRAAGGNLWLAIGFHMGLMTATQLLAPARGLAQVDGMPTLQFVGFILVPSIAVGLWIDWRRPDFSWTAGPADR